MRKRRFLLLTSALSTTVVASACHKEAEHTTNAVAPLYDAEAVPLPANPKGSTYDSGLTPAIADASTAPVATSDASTSPRPPPPANPKGSHYDAGLPGPKPKAK